MRKTWLGWMMAVAAALTGSPAGAQRAPSPSRELVREAYLFGFPAYEMMRVRSRMAAAGGNGANRFGHRTDLSSARNREVTAPNNDTLYSSAWIDLAAGPVTMVLPRLPNRYHSVELMDLFTDAFAVLGTRAQRGRGGRFLIAGPEWRGVAPRGVTLVRAPTNDVWAITRIVVDGPPDLAAARAAQAAFRVEAPAGAFRPFAPPTPAEPDPAAFLAAVNTALARAPLPALHRDRVKRFAAVGLVPGDTAAWDRLTPDVRAMWTEVLPAVRTQLRQAFTRGGRRINGWGYPAPGLAAFGTNDLFRSVVALGGLAALPAEEAMYLNTTQDGAGQPLDGAKRYRLRVPANVPVDGFWSLTMYEDDGTGRFFFYDNPIDRYAIGDRTPGLVREPDGSVVIALQHDRPAPGERVNWLPAPAKPFRLSFRAYLPRAAFRDGRFRLPPIVEQRYP